MKKSYNILKVLILSCIFFQTSESSEDIKNDISSIENEDIIIETSTVKPVQKIRKINNDLMTVEDREFVKMIRERLREKAEAGSQKEKDEIFKWTDFYVDGYILNWVLYNDRDLDKTEAAILKSINWRVKNNFQKIFDYTPPQYLIDNYPMNITGLTKIESLPVIFVPGGKWDFAEGIKRGYKNDMIKMLLFVTEMSIHFLHEEYYSTHIAEPAGQFIVIVDMKGLQMKQVTSIRVLSMLAVSMDLTQAHWPFAHRELVTVNAPGIFKILLDLAKSVLSEKTFSRIFVYDSDKSKWTPHLKKLVTEPELYPEQLL